ncbi:hypothetical protein Mp_3g15900 [Marchantia polymorpha subsp. ruderalis]|uniref:Uncharacterized protein n=2 Tax=Marchantia polymorpha TaxID=3197 RepID=A0AAF6B1A0_MARPO|nr:hypothetical protein MARPO_0004s0081 [Marchantia polymorpha]BBN05784.1 hypothetical protein Mp_3g15900 [Marchantia polymorpha subsp. ruderalis]|eukprot:PTQ48794.1 hypothetical protein MARPO_0004s0081 [Marchantia polymorpha]
MKFLRKASNHSEIVRQPPERSISKAAASDSNHNFPPKSIDKVSQSCSNSKSSDRGTTQKRSISMKSLSKESPFVRKCPSPPGDSSGPRVRDKTSRAKQGKLRIGLHHHRHHQSG